MDVDVDVEEEEGEGAEESGDVSAVPEEASSAPPTGGPLDDASSAGGGPYPDAEAEAEDEPAAAEEEAELPKPDRDEEEEEEEEEEDEEGAAGGNLSKWLAEGGEGKGGKGAGDGEEAAKGGGGEGEDLWDAARQMKEAELARERERAEEVREQCVALRGVHGGGERMKSAHSRVYVFP